MTKSSSLWLALLPIVVLIALLVFNVLFYGDSASLGPNQIALLIAAAIAGVIGRCCGVSVESMLAGVHHSVGASLKAILILLMIGALIGTWVISGIVPAMIYYGLQILSPKIFLAASVVVCAIVSLATGSSWSTVGTVGVALLGIGQAMGISEAMTAGAIISGAYFGDKISPLSDTTNLAAAMAGTELMTHIRYMLLTTVPSILISLAIFLWIGFAGEESIQVEQAELLLGELESHFHLTPWLFVVPLVVFGLILWRVDAVVALFAGAILGGLAAIAFQPQVVTRIADLPPVEFSDESAEDSNQQLPPYYQRSYVAVINAMAFRTSVYSDAEISQLESESQSAKLAAVELMQGKGMEGMLTTVWLILCAMTFGGVMAACGFLKRITESLLSLARSTGSLIATTAGSCLFVNVTASDQYLSIVVPGQMFREPFLDRGLAPENLSRTLEDSGTVTSVLIPWNTCGAFQSNALGVATFAYAPFCFFNWISPLMTIAYGFTGLLIARRQLDEPVTDPDSSD